MNGKEEKKFNTKKINELVHTGNKILKILYVLFILLLIYVLTLIFRDWGMLMFLFKILKVISPLFIGFFIAWLLNPLVIKLTDRKVNRVLAVVIVYSLMLVFMYLLFAYTVPQITNQISDVVVTIPKIMDGTKGWIDSIFIKLSNLSSQNLDSVKLSFITRITEFALNISKNLPETVVTVISSIISGIGTIFLSLIIGFYILFGYDKFLDNSINLFPKKIRKDVIVLSKRLSDSVYSFVSGTLWLSLLLFIVSIIGFYIIGLKAPVIVSVVCIITNLIPYIGPYIGAAFASLIGFTQSPLIGVFTLIFIFIVQTIEGNLLQPIVMSKKVNLSPITIIISLLIFGYFWGMFGMIIATPLMAIIKVLYEFFDEKYNFFSYKEDK